MAHTTRPVTVLIGGRWDGLEIPLSACPDEIGGEIRVDDFTAGEGGITPRPGARRWVYSFAGPTSPLMEARSC